MGTRPQFKSLNCHLSTQECDIGESRVVRPEIICSPYTYTTACSGDSGGLVGANIDGKWTAIGKSWTLMTVLINFIEYHIGQKLNLVKVIYRSIEVLPFSSDSTTSPEATILAI